MATGNTKFTTQHGLYVVDAAQLTGNVAVDGQLLVTNTAAVGNTTITGFANVSSTLNVTGNVTALANVDITGDTTIGGNSAITGVLTVLGNTIISGTLVTTSTGSSNIAGSYGIGNNLVVAGYANVIGSIQTSSSLAVAGNTTMAGWLVVSGTANVVSNTYLRQNLTVTNTASFSNTLSVIGAATFANTVGITGILTIANTVTGAVYPTTDGTAFGNTSLRYNITANSAVINGLATFSTNTVPASNAVNLGLAAQRWNIYSTNINNSDSITVSNNATVSNNLTVANTVTINADVAITGNSVATSGTTQQVIDAFPAATYRSTKYVVEGKDATTGYMTTELLIVHDGTTVLLNEYGTVNTVATFATYDADISLGNVRLLVTPTIATATFKVVRTSIAI